MIMKIFDRLNIWILLDLKIARKEKKLYHVHTEDLNADYALGKGNYF